MTTIDTITRSRAQIRGDGAEHEHPLDGAFLPASVYLAVDDRKALEQAVSAIRSYAGTFGFEECERLELQYGSLFQRLRLRMRNPATREELARRVELAEHALMQQTLGRTQAEINVMQAEAAERAARMIQGNDNQVVAFGSIIAVARREPDGHIVRHVVELTPDELVAVYKNRRPLRNPAAFIEFLAGRRAESDVHDAQLLLPVSEVPAGQLEP
ncbi:MAG TPA: hypothetical protein VF545_07320 [Thermoleophilaceae bacterium]|jgi:hypothetical protein